MFTLTAQQEEIIAWFKAGPSSGNLVVVARAGSAKTTTAVAGVLVAPERSILLCAYSKIIQVELEKRIGKNNPKIKARTLHSVGLACIHKFRENIKISFDGSREEEITEAVCGDTVPVVIKKLVSKLHTKAREIAPHARVAGDLLDLALRFDCEPEEEWANSGFPLEFIEEKALEALEWASYVPNGATIDGSDMIFLPVRNKWLVRQYDLVVVDEAQDMTSTQLEVALGVLKPNGRMAVIGDDRQAIFAWRGADSEALGRLGRELKAQKLYLTKTFRCGHTIVDLAKSYVPDFVADAANPLGEILSIPSDDLTECAKPGDFILSRTNAPLVMIALKFLREGKRVQIAGGDIGKGLVALIRSLRAKTLDELIIRVATWEQKKLSSYQQLLAAEKKESRKNSILSKMDETTEKAEMIRFFCEDADNLDGLFTKMTNLFKGDGLGAEGLVTCSSVHRAKGLEANRVFILRGTLREYNIEEQNICYVAITRAKHSLIWVENAGRNV